MTLLGLAFNEHEFNKGLEGLEAPGADLDVNGGALTPIQNVTPYRKNFFVIF